MMAAHTRSDAWIRRLFVGTLALLLASGLAVAQARAGTSSANYAWNLVAVGTGWLMVGWIASALLRLCLTPQRSVSRTRDGLAARTPFGPVKFAFGYLRSARALYLPGVTSRVLLIVLELANDRPVSMLVVDPWGRLPTPVRDALSVLAGSDPSRLNVRLRVYMGFPVTRADRVRSAFGGFSTAAGLGLLLLAVDSVYEVLGAGLGIFTA